MGVVQILSVVVICLGISACGQNSKSYRLNDSGIPTYDFLSQGEAQSEYDKWQVQCLDANKCPDTVGQLLVLQDRSISICTATLISEDTILTNSHCFDIQDRSNRLVKEQKVCDDGVAIVFASNSPAGREQALCKKVLTKSYISPMSLHPDYMIIQLDRKLKRGFNTVVRSGMQDRQKLLIRKVNPTKRGLGHLDVQECEVLHRTVILPNADKSDYFVHVVKGCEVIQGNSGSSLVDSEGKIRGVVFQGILPGDTMRMNRFQKMIHSKALELKTSLVTNATCIDYPFSGEPTVDSEKCLKDQDNLGEVSQLIDRSEFRRKLETQMLNSSYLSDRFGYSLQYRAGSMHAFYTPSCLRPSNSQSRSRTETATVLMWEPEYGLNDRLKPFVESIKTQEHDCQIRWSPKDLKLNGQSSVSMTGNYCYDSRGNQGATKDVWTQCDP